MPQRPATAHAVPVEPGPAWSLADAELTTRFHPLYASVIPRVQGGRMVSRGLPFVLPPDGTGPRWLAVDGRVEVDLGGIAATHLVLLAFCDAWRDEGGKRPAGVPVGWVMPVGEPLARARVMLEDGDPVETVLRRRFEVNEGLVGWGSMAFLALPHRVEGPVDWRGPHARTGTGRYAPPGHSGPLTILPGSWGPGQTGVEDHVPSPSGDITLWLHAIEVGAAGAPGRLAALELEPIAGEGDGRLVVIAALTAFSGTASPLRWAPRRSLALQGANGLPVEVDLGVIARRGTLARPAAPRPITGWGDVTPVLTAHGAAEAPDVAEAGEEEVEVAAAADAVLAVGGSGLALREVHPGGRPAEIGRARLRALPDADRRMGVSLVDEAGRTLPARVRFVAADGRYLPPLGHRAEVNPGLAEDLGADVLLGAAAWAYIDGDFEIDLPPGGARMEAMAGPARPPLAAEVTSGDVEHGSLQLAFGAALRPAAGRWVSGDTHVHFLAPSTALLQARAEGVNAVHLLATQWGEHHTSLTDVGGDALHASGEHAVWVGSENRQNMLGHIGIVGTSRPVLPFASGGAPEGRIGGPVTHLMADWLRRCRELGGLAIAAHYPLPLAEVVADIEAGLVDALEMQCFDMALQSPPIREWYRALDAGYRLPLVAGTDKMSAEVPLGQVRTWARLADGEALTFASWARAVRAGRTFVSSGPVLELRVEGFEPGDVITVPPGTDLEVEVVARAAQPVISDVELVHDGEVTRAVSTPEPATALTLRERVRVERSGWLAARSRSPFAIGSAFATAMAAHTSAVYLEVPGRPQPPADMSTSLTVVDGTRAWLEQLAPVRDERERERFRRFLDESERGIRERGGGT
jgi:hypothetical protein